ncbi:hypothetical protein T439DRAFT_382221 [Meredithblackwellia eburnea MCA 4105]
MLSRRTQDTQTSTSSNKPKRNLFGFGKSSSSNSPPAPSSPKQDQQQPAKSSSSSRKGSNSPLSPITPQKPLPPRKDDLLNGSSSPSKVPQDWSSWNKSYASGEMDFNDPPPPPSKLADAAGVRSVNGQHRAPVPLNEKKRQKAVDSLGFITRDRRRGSASSSSSTSSTASTSSSASADSSDYWSDSTVSSTSSLGSVSEHPVTACLMNPLPTDLECHAFLQDLVERAALHFDVSACTVSLMDDDKQVMLATHGFDVPEISRDCTVCSHAVVKYSTGQTEPFVVLDFSRDWRFIENDFGPFDRGFYASVPIHIPAPFGDKSAKTYVGGVFCIVDVTARKSFSDEERDELHAFAAEATAELTKQRRRNEQGQRDKLVVKRDEWSRRSKVVKKIAVKSPLDTVVEVLTPPTSPEVSQEDEPSPEAVLNGPRRPSLARTLTSESTSSAIVTTEVTPTFSGRRNARGLHASSQSRIAPEVQSMLDLSTRLIGESLDLDFTYLLAVDLPTTSNRTTTTPMTSKQVRLLSSHNIPIPAPLFDVQLHIETLVSSHNALLYSDPEFSGAEGEYATGLLVKVGAADGVGYVLGGFAESKSRVLNRQDFLFFRSFAADLKKYTVDVL